MPRGDHRPPRYQRPAESAAPLVPSREVTPAADHDAAIEASSLSDGSRTLLRGLMRLGRTAMYSGGGVGLDYAGLLKTALRPDILRLHVDEAVAVLREQQIDLLLVPGMSGFPIGTMYAMGAGIPAQLLRKEPWRGEGRERTLPPGSFTLPSYTSAGEVLMTEDPIALIDITDGIFRGQVEHHKGDGPFQLSLRVAVPTTSSTRRRWHVR